MTVENVIRRIIDHHNQIDNEGHHRFWHEKLEHEHSKRAEELIDQLDHTQHHIGDYYRENGLRIHLEKESPEATNLLKVMKFIFAGLNQDEGAPNKTVAVDRELFLGQEIVDEFDSELAQYQQIYGSYKQKARSMTSIDLFEEEEVKAIAVSILAETNGSVKMAQDILSFAGLKIIKSMNIPALKNLTATLKSLSTQTDLSVPCPPRHH
ncbi:MAG: hypothetical protein V4612_07040 [Pseudomonadota bacterium]